MPTVFSNQELNGKDTIWRASNGATRRTLCLVNKVTEFKNTLLVNCSVGFLDKGNHSFIFLNPIKNTDLRLLGLFLNSSYGYRLVKGRALYENSSVGGYGNSESKFGVYELGTILAVDSYKGRQGEDFWELTTKGWVCLGADIPIDEEEVTEI